MGDRFLSEIRRATTLLGESLRMGHRVEGQLRRVILRRFPLFADLCAPCRHTPAALSARTLRTPSGSLGGYTALPNPSRRISSGVAAVFAYPMALDIRRHFRSPVYAVSSGHPCSMRGRRATSKRVPCIRRDVGVLWTTVAHRCASSCRCCSGRPPKLLIFRPTRTERMASNQVVGASSPSGRAIVSMA